MGKIVSRNPATGETIREIEATRLEELNSVFEKARLAQAHWRMKSVRDRAHFLLQLKEIILDDVDNLVDLISKENGKPRFEAMANEVLPALDMLSLFAKKSPKLLKDHPIPLRLMKHKKSYLNYWPLGVVAVISPWNYPFLLPLGDILMAIVAGNSVIFKPSEITPCIGLKIQDLCHEAGLPPNVLQTLIGDGGLGAAIIPHKPEKIFFTGSAATGRKIMAAAAEHLIPLNLELGGKDAMIVLPDANLDFATSAALWGGFSNSGQICASTERILVHERIAEPFLEQLKHKVEFLRQGPSTGQENDLGPITFEKQKQIYMRHLEEARSKNAVFVTGGEFSKDSRYLLPTIIKGPNVETLEVYREETFGPVVAVTTFKSVSEAVEKANQSKYGLVASIITKNIPLGEEIAKQLEVGTVTINEVTYTAGLGETPWGGVKESGFGRTHSEAGIYEFVNTRHIHKPRSRFLVFKSLWWFPYSSFQFSVFRIFLKTYRRSWIDKLRAWSHFAWNLVKMIKNEKRI